MSVSSSHGAAPARKTCAGVARDPRPGSEAVVARTGAPAALAPHAPPASPTPPLSPDGPPRLPTLRTCVNKPVGARSPPYPRAHAECAGPWSFAQ